jgi:CelD/BcsL family acetyltransferase involved in cellulose biosynthesis
MKLTVIRGLTAWNELASDWNKLLAGSTSPVPFLRHEYLVNWWSAPGAADDWPNPRLHIVTARRGGKLAAIAPLFESIDHDGQPLLALVGSDVLSDYLDLIVRPDNLREFIELLFDHLVGPDGPPCRVLDLYNIRDGSPSLPVLAEAAANRGWNYTKEEIIPYSSVNLPAGWDNFLNGLEKKQRHEIRRKLKNAEGSGNVRCYVADDPARLAHDVEALFELMAHRQDKAQFLTSGVRRYFHELIACAGRNGWLQLAFLEVDGRKAAAFLNFDYANRIWVHNTGMDPAFRDLSPGMVLLGHLIQRAIEQGRSAIDFLRGEEPYKRHFGATARPLWRVTIAWPGP